MYFPLCERTPKLCLTRKFYSKGFLPLFWATIQFPTFKGALWILLNYSLESFQLVYNICKTFFSLQYMQNFFEIYNGVYFSNCIFQNSTFPNYIFFNFQTDFRPIIFSKLYLSKQYFFKVHFFQNCIFSKVHLPKVYFFKMLFPKLYFRQFVFCQTVFSKCIQVMHWALGTLGMGDVRRGIGAAEQERQRAEIQCRGAKWSRGKPTTDSIGATVHIVHTVCALCYCTYCEHCIHCAHCAHCVYTASMHFYIGTDSIYSNVHIVNTVCTLPQCTSRYRFNIQQCVRCLYILGSSLMHFQVL